MVLEEPANLHHLISGNDLIMATQPSPDLFRPVKKYSSKTQLNIKILHQWSLQKRTVSNPG